jgi:hypothetical protein
VTANDIGFVIGSSIVLSPNIVIVIIVFITYATQKKEEDTQQKGSGVVVGEELVCYVVCLKL